MGPAGQRAEMFHWPGCRGRFGDGCGDAGCPSWFPSEQERYAAWQAASGDWLDVGRAGQRSWAWWWYAVGEHKPLELAEQVRRLDELGVLEPWERAQLAVWEQSDGLVVDEGVLDDDDESDEDEDEDG